MVKSDFNPFGNLQDPGYEFDMSISTLMRINYYLYICNQHSRSEDVSGLKYWFDSVRIVDREIDPLLKTKERELLEDFRSEAEKAVNAGKGYDFRNVYRKIDVYEREVRRFVHEKKLYMKQAEDAGTAIIR